MLHMRKNHVGTKTLDTSGTWCPEPLMMISEIIEEMASGQCLQVICTDPASLRDVPKYCLALGHPLLDSKTDTDQTYRFLIQVK